MLRIVALLILQSIAFSGFCQKSEILDGMAMICSPAEQIRLKSKVLTFSAKVSKKRPQSDSRFLKKVFYSAHHKFLKDYQPYSSLNQLVNTGTYDCLTATSLYSSILEILGFEFKIIETNYHIFLIAKAEGKQFLLETTDGFSGFIYNEEEILRREKEYQNGNPSSVNSNSFEYDFKLLNEVKGPQLAGLIYFNQAVKEFNQHNWAACLELLDKSEKIHSSPRVREIKELAYLNSMKDTKSVSHLIGSISKEQRNNNLD